MFDLITGAWAHERELAVRSLEVTHRMQWYEASAVERLERRLRAARRRLHVVANPVAEAS